MMIVATIENIILFYHPETGKYNVKTYIPHKELDADVVIDKDSDFEISKWYERNDGFFYSATGRMT